MMGRRRTWNHVPGNTLLTAYWASGEADFHAGWICEKNDKPLPQIVQQEIAQLNTPEHPIDVEDQLILDINWSSSGSYDPGCTYGPPERCYPPEGDDERTLSGRVTIECGTVKARLSETASEELFAEFYDIVSDQELDYDSRDDDRSDERYQRWKDEPHESYFNRALNNVLID